MEKSIINKGMFTSRSDEWETPKDFFNKLNKEFNFTLDVCASINNYKCSHYFDRLDDGLSKNWFERNFLINKEVAGAIWMNPPYGRQIDKWIEKAFKESINSTVVCLLPARTDTLWFHNYVMKAKEIRFVKGRLKFGNAKNTATFPSMLVVFGKGLSTKQPKFSTYLKK